MNGKDKFTDEYINELRKKFVSSKDNISENLQDDKVSEILSKMSKADADKIKNIMNDKEQMEKILNSKQAQIIMKKLSEGK